MSLRLIYWILMLLALVVGYGWPVYTGLMAFLLFLILGWQVFGAPVKRE